MSTLIIKGLALLTAIISIHTMSAQFQVKLADLDHGRIRVEPALPADGVVAPFTGSITDLGTMS